ncbi:MAG: hypothetical protein PHV50_02970 [Syntrophaceticus sp.]|nr:hypothetical protein [Syntrophaceticus sp.]MDD4359505.1 hypothetical protein [Syntrophaceticus sp.]
MRKWRVGTISMGLVLIGTGLGLFFAKINNKAIFDAVVRWWPLVFVLLGLEVLVLSFWGKDNNSLVKYDIFSIFIILLIVFCGLGFYSLEGIGVTAKINDYLTSHEYRIRTSTSEIAVEPEVERLVISAPFCGLKIQTSETNKISSYSYALARADSQEAAKNLADKGTELISNTSGNTQFISFQLPAIENVQTTEYTIIIPQNIDVELHNGDSVQIYTYELDNDWKIASSGDLQIFIPRQADLTIRALVDESNTLGGSVTWEGTETTEETDDSSNNAKKVVQVELGNETQSMDIALDSGSSILVNQL